MRAPPRSATPSRRRVLIGLAGASLASLGCGLPRWAFAATSSAVTFGLAREASREMGADDARHLLTRIGFGASPAQIAEFSRLSRQDAVDRLLADGQQTPQTPIPADILDYESPRRMRDSSDEERKAMQRDMRQRGLLLRAWWLGEMVNAPNALHERMTLFWHNHFTSSLEKVRAPALMARQNLLLRHHALGHFGELLHAISRDPAMLVYLDGAQSRKEQPNENFAREVMELFTLGEGHYTEQDIKEAARAFTGWSIEPETGAFRWRPFFHDDGVKTVLGQSGRLDGDAVLDILLNRPETAQWIAGKLWREFVSPTPDEAEVRRLAMRFRHAGYQIKPTLRTLLLSDAFWAAGNRAALVKSPVDLVVGTLRTFDMTLADASAALPYAFAAAQMDQNLLAPPNVKGWPGGDVWINSKTLLARRQFIEHLLRDDAPRDAPAGMARRVALKETFGKGANSLDDEAREALRRSFAAMRLDTPRWLDAAARNGLTPDQVLLPIAGVAGAGGAGDTSERTDDMHAVRRWMLDPAYQLK